MALEIGLKETLKTVIMLSAFAFPSPPAIPSYFAPQHPFMFNPPVLQIRYQENERKERRVTKNNDRANYRKNSPQ